MGEYHGWAIKHPDYGLNPVSFERTRKDVLDQVFGPGERKFWRELRGRGWRLVKVKVTEVT